MSQYPTKTYELEVSFAGEGPQIRLQTKERLIAWLLGNGVESFVEGVLDVEVLHEYGEPEPDYYEELGGGDTPVSIYRYSRESLDDLRARLEHTFGEALLMELKVMETETWMEGWKESFKPFATELFFVCPPWIKEVPPPGKLALIIQPGMAFGTGQHATTKLCLGELEVLVKRSKDLGSKSVLDVGTGTGILAIAAKKIGYGTVSATDIDDDAILAATENARENCSELNIKKGSVPAEGAYDLVFANILAIVLKKIMADLARATKQGGHLIMAGLLTEEADEVCQVAESYGLSKVRESELEGWGCLVMTRTAG